MPSALAGKAAIITGSTSGIGTGIARALAAHGADILLNGFGDQAQIAELRKTLAGTHGVRVGYSRADLSRPAECVALVEQATAELGRVDILIEFVTVEQIGALAVFLCSEAAAQIRGAALSVDGGWTAQ